MKSDGSRPWYAEGLRFTCQPDCGACCTNHDDYSFVYLVGDDASRLARFLELSLETFRERYTELDGDEPVLSMEHPDCPFLDGTRCGVYEARPTQCRTFPFWPQNLGSRRDWRRLKTFCPGIDVGETHSLIAIEGRRRHHENDGLHE